MSMSRQDAQTSAPADRADAVRAFYEFPPVSPADQRSFVAPRSLSGRASAPGAIAFAVAFAKAAARQKDPDRWLWDVAGGKICLRRASCRRDGDRHQPNQFAPYAQPSEEAWLAESQSPSAGDRARRRARRDLRPDRLHRGAPPSRRPRRRSSIVARRPCPRRRAACDGVRRLRPRRRRHDARLLPAHRDWRRSGGVAGPRRR